MRIPFFLFSALALSSLVLFEGCSPKLYNADYSADRPSEIEESATSARISFAARENGDSAEIPEIIREAYRRELSKNVPDDCLLRLSFDGSVEEHYASLWYMGLFILAPLWPAMPRNDDLSILLSAELECDGIVVESVKIFEEEHPRLFWYGPYRNGYMQDRADLLHKKLVRRLDQALSPNVPADGTIRPDYF